MIENSKEKKNIFYLVVLVLTLIVMIIGTSLAYYIFISSQKKDATVLYTGTLEINYVDGIYLKDPILYPKRGITFDTFDDVYRNNFIVRSSGTLDQTIKVDMIISNNEFPDNNLRYTLYSTNGNQLSTGYINGTGRINLINNYYLASSDTSNYVLIIWLENNSSYQNPLMGNKVTGRIEVQGIQVRK